MASEKKSKEMKEIRLVVAQRYLRRYGGELMTEEHHLTMTGYFGTPPKNIVRYCQGVAVYLRDVQHQKIAEVTTGLPTVVCTFNVRTGEFKQEIPY